MNAVVSRLEFEAVRWAGEPPLSLRVGPGECVWLPMDADDSARAARAGHAACGIESPLSGVVRFAGEDWAALGPADAERRRARIGRVFGETAWVSNLDVDENVLLAPLHHTARPPAELREEADRLARSFGLAALPAGRAAWCPPRDLQRAQWIRALLGAPDLLLLEFPERYAPSTALAAFRSAVDAARARGAGVLWISGREPGGPFLRAAWDGDPAPA